MTNIQVRRADSSDLDQVHQLAAKFGMFGETDAVTFLDTFERIVNDSNWLLVVAERIGTMRVGTNILGYAMAQDYQRGLRESFTTGRIRDLFVIPGSRGCGVGTALLAAVIEWASSRPQAMILDWQAPIHAVPFYESNGFTADYEGDTHEFPAFSLDLRSQ